MSWPTPRRDDRPIRSWEDADQQLQEARAEIARLRLTDAERTAIRRLIEDYEGDGEPASRGRGRHAARAAVAVGRLSDSGQRSGSEQRHYWQRVET